MANRFANRRINIVGNQGSGKTTLARQIAAAFRNVVVYDLQDEWDAPNLTSYVPMYSEYGDAMKDEMDEVVRQLVADTANRVRKTDLFIIDDADTFLPNGRPLPPEMLKLHTSMRHMKAGPGCDPAQEGLSLLCLFRRPADINTKIDAMAHRTFYFQAFGANDLQRCEATMKGLGRIVRTLSPHEFVEVGSDGFLRCYSPLPAA